MITLYFDIFRSEVIESVFLSALVASAMTVLFISPIGYPIAGFPVLTIAFNSILISSPTSKFPLIIKLFSLVGVCSFGIIEFIFPPVTSVTSQDVKANGIVPFVPSTTIFVNVSVIIKFVIGDSPIFSTDIL